MFETTFQYVSSTPLPPNVEVETGIQILHDCETILRLGPDCRGCKSIPPPPQVKNGQNKPHGKAVNGDGLNGTQEEVQYYEVEDDLPFIPKRLWSGGVRYQADFLPTQDGCIITVHAPGGFTSKNHWKLLREAIPEDSPPRLERAQSKDLLHAKTGGAAGWYVQIVSDAVCSRTFASFVKGFLKNSHQQLQRAFIEKLQSSPAQQRSNRPTLGRRRSSEL